MPTENEKPESDSRKLIKACAASLVICIALMFVAHKAQENGDLLRAFILAFTSNIVMLVYLFGLRKYINKAYKDKKDAK